MWSFLILFCFVYFSLGVSLMVPTSEERYNFFNIDLFQSILDEVEGNVIVSPASAKVALTTLIEGTKGRSRQQILSALRFPPEESIIRSVSKTTLKSLKGSNNGTEIDVINRVWVGSRFNVTPYYKEILNQHYESDIESVDFSNINNSTTIINEWARNVTRNNVQSIVDSNNLSPTTRILFTSALYFKGMWLKTFPKTSTQSRCFKIPNGKCKHVNMMENLSTYRYAYIPSLDADIVEIPYSGGKMSMMIMLPNREDTDEYLQILSKDLSYIPISVLLASLKDTEIHLSIPKFTIENKLDLRMTLERIGIRDIFDLNADLSGISSEAGLQVGSVLQNAKIKVDEEGTVATAVTSVGVIPLMGSTTPSFKANRPFLYAIVDLQTNGTLFAGRFIEPSPSDLVYEPHSKLN